MTDAKFTTAIAAHKATFGKLQDELSSDRQEGEGLLKRDATDLQKPEEISAFCASLNELLERMERTISVFITCVNDWDVKTKEQRDAKAALETDIAKGKENIEDGFTLWRKLKKKERTMGGCNKETKTGTATQSTGTSKGSVKLPQTQLPKFNGSIQEFQGFWDVFNATVHDNTGLSPVQKLTYLMDCLTGPAIDVIKGLRTCDGTYEVARTLLEDRFGSKQAAVEAHYTALMDIPVCTSKTESLRACVDKLEIHLRSLEAQGRECIPIRIHHYCPE